MTIMNKNMKKVYKIRIAGECEGSCLRELNNAEYNLIKDIFKECDTALAGGYIDEVKRRYVVKVMKEINMPGLNRPNSAVYMLGFKYINDDIMEWNYPTYENRGQFHYMFDTLDEALLFAENTAKQLGCEVNKQLEYNETL